MAGGSRAPCHPYLTEATLPCPPRPSDLTAATAFSVSDAEATGCHVCCQSVTAATGSPVLRSTAGVSANIYACARPRAGRRGTAPHSEEEARRRAGSRYASVTRAPCLPLWAARVMVSSPRRRISATAEASELQRLRRRRRFQRTPE